VETVCIIVFSPTKTFLVGVLDWLGCETPKKCTCIFSHESVNSSPASSITSLS